MRKYRIEFGKHFIDIETEGQIGTISSNLKGDDTEEDYAFNCAIDGIESLILACACAELNVESDPFVKAIETAVEACANNL